MDDSGCKSGKKLKEDFPDEPWRWKAIWAGETIPECFRGRQHAIDSYSIWSAAIIAPLILVSAATGAFSQSWYAWLLLILVGLWLLPAMATWRGLRKRWSIGWTHLKLETPFGEPGRVLEGEIRLGRDFELPENAKIGLTCEKIATDRSSDGDSKFTQTVWRSGNDVTKRETPVRSFPLSRLPLSFEIPIHAKESMVDGDTEYQWKVKLEVPGQKIQSEFEVPVFHTQASRKLASENPSNEIEYEQITNEQLRDRLSKNGIQIRFDGNDRLHSLVCDPERHRNQRIPFGVFCSIWSLIAVFLFLWQVNRWFQILWTIISFVLWLSLIWWALNRRIVRFEDALISVTNEVGPWKRTATFNHPSLSDVSHSVSMQSGRTRYFQVQIKGLKGKKIPLADGISEESMARSVADAVSEWLRWNHEKD